jgi:hypothetical protein
MHTQHRAADTERLMLDQGAIDAARKNLDLGAVTPHYGPWRQDIGQITRARPRSQPLKTSPARSAA